VDYIASENKGTTALGSASCFRKYYGIMAQKGA